MQNRTDKVTRKPSRVLCAIIGLGNWFPCSITATWSIRKNTALGVMCGKAIKGKENPTQARGSPNHD